MLHCLCAGTTQQPGHQGQGAILLPWASVGEPVVSLGRARATYGRISSAAVYTHTQVSHRLALYGPCCIHLK